MFYVNRLFLPIVFVARAMLKILSPVTFLIKKNDEWYSDLLTEVLSPGSFFIQNKKIKERILLKLAFVIGIILRIFVHPFRFVCRLFFFCPYCWETMPLAIQSKINPRYITGSGGRLVKVPDNIPHEIRYFQCIGCNRKYIYDWFLSEIQYIPPTII